MFGLIKHAPCEKTIENMDLKSMQKLIPYLGRYLKVRASFM